MRKKRVLILGFVLLIIFSISVLAETASWRTYYKGTVQKRISYIKINRIYTSLTAITGRQAIQWDEDREEKPYREPKIRRVDLTKSNPNYISSCRSYVNDFMTGPLMDTIKQNMIDFQTNKLRENVRRMQLEINELSRKYYEAEDANDEEAKQGYLRQILEINNSATVLKEHYDFITTDDDFWISYFCDKRSDFGLLEGCANSMQKTHSGYPDANIYQTCEDCIRQYREKYCKKRVFDEEEITEIITYIPYPKDIVIGGGGEQIKPRDFEKLKIEGKKEKKKFDEYLRKCKECKQKGKTLEKEADKIKSEWDNLRKDFKKKLTKIENLEKEKDKADKEKEKFFKEKSWAESGNIKVTDVDLRLRREASKQAWQEYRKSPSREKAKWVENRWKHYSTPEGRKELRNKASELFDQNIHSIKERIEKEKIKKEKIAKEIESKKRAYKKALEEANKAKKEYDDCFKKHCIKKPEPKCQQGQFTNEFCDRECAQQFCKKVSNVPECYECKIPERPKTGPPLEDIVPKKPGTTVPPPKQPPKIDCQQKFPGMELLPAMCPESCKEYGNFDKIPDKKICHNYKIEIKFFKQGDQICCARKITEIPIPGCSAENWGGWTKSGKAVMKEQPAAPIPIPVSHGTEEADIIEGKQEIPQQLPETATPVN